MSKASGLKTWIVGGAAVCGVLLQTGCVVSVGTYQQAWYDVWGYRCGTGYASPGCNFYSDGSKIQAWEDPSYDSYYSYSSYTEWGYYTYYDSYGWPASYLGYGWVSPSTGILYDDWGYALNSVDGASANQEQDTGRNVEQSIAQAVDNVNEEVAQKFAADHTKDTDTAETHAALLETGRKIAKTMREVDNILQNRAVVMNANSQVDEEAIIRKANDLFGTQGNQIVEALKSAERGDMAALVSFNADVSRHWNLDQGKTKEVLKSMFKKHAERYSF